MLFTIYATASCSGIFRKDDNCSSNRPRTIFPHIGSGLGEPRPHGTVWLWARPSHRVATLVAVGAAGATCDKCGVAVVVFVRFQLPPGVDWHFGSGASAVERI